MRDRRVTRRQVLRGTALGLSLPALSAVLGACGRDHADELGLDRLGDAPADGRSLSFLAIQRTSGPRASSPATSRSPPARPSG
jgi:hypothetical protein